MFSTQLKLLPKSIRFIIRRYVYNGKQMLHDDLLNATRSITGKDCCYDTLVFHKCKPTETIHDWGDNYFLTTWVAFQNHNPYAICKDCRDPMIYNSKNYGK